MQSTYERGLAGSSSVIPLDYGCQLRVQRRSRNLHQFRGFGPEQRGADRQLGIKLLQHRPVERELADIAGRAPRPPLPAGHDSSCNRRSGPRPGSPPAGRSVPKPAPASAPAAPAFPRSRPRPGCRAQIPAQSADLRSGPACARPSPRGQPRSSRRRCGRDTAAPHRGGLPAATSGRDCSSRCTSVPRNSARARSWIDSPVLTGWPSSAPGSDGRSRLSAAGSAGAVPRSHDGSSARALSRRSGGPGRGGRDVLGPRIALHHAVAGLDVLQLQSGIAEAFDDQVVPGEFAHAVHVARHAAADDQAVGRPRHRHIEQAAVFVLGLAQHRGAGGGNRGRIVGLPAGPDHDAGRMQAAHCPAAGGSASGAGYPTATRWCRPGTRRGPPAPWRHAPS